MLHRRLVRRFLILALASAATLQCGPSPSQPTPALSRDLTGRWVQSPTGNEWVLTQSGSAVSGSVVRPVAAADAVVTSAITGTVAGTAFEFIERTTTTWADGRVCPSSLSGTLTWRDDGIWFGTATDIPAPPCSARPFTHQVTLVRK